LVALGLKILMDQAKKEMNEIRLKLTKYSTAKYKPYQFANTKTPTPFGKELEKKNDCFFSFFV
jgi:hypothetical protein